MRSASSSTANLVSKDYLSTNAGILEQLRSNGDMLDHELAAALDVSLPKVRHALAELIANGDLMTCKLIRFEKGKEVAQVLYRARGYTPPRNPGPKPK